MAGWQIGRKVFLAAVFLTGTHGLSAQVVLEDWSCSRAATITNSNPAVVTCDTSHNLPGRTVSGQDWVMHLEGATGSWAAVSGRHKIRILSGDRFQIPVDTSSFGPFDGQQVTLVRSNHLRSESDYRPGDLTFTGYSGIVNNVGLPDPGNLFTVQVPVGYTSTLNARYCRRTKITGFSVSAGEATVTLDQPLPNNPPAWVVGPGREIHFQNLTHEALNSRPVLRGADSPHYISQLSSDWKTVKVGVAVPDGEYGVDGQVDPVALVCPINSLNFMFHPRQYALAYPYPEGRVSNYVKNPPVPADANRMYMWVKWGKTIDRRADGGTLASLGTYVKAPDDPNPRAERFHFYHLLDPNFYADRWMLIEINATPQHCRSGSGTAGYPNEPLLSGWEHYTSPPWDHLQARYIPNLTYFYLDTTFYSRDFSGQTVQISPITIDTEKGEPDAYVASVTAVWAPQRLQNRGPGYEIGFAVPKYSTATYEIRYSTGGSLKERGFSQGKAGGQVEALNSSYTGVIWYSESMEEQENIWFGIRPKMSVLGVSGLGVSPIVVTLLTQPLMDNGDHVTISGVQGNSAANATDAPIQNRPAPLWRLSTGLEKIEVVRNVATVHLGVDHNLVPGQVVHVYGTTDQKLGDSTAARRHTIAEVPTSRTFTLQVPGAADGSYSADLRPAARLSVRVLPSFSVPGTGDGDYKDGGTVVSNEEFKNFTEIEFYPFSPEEMLSRISGHERRRASQGRQ